jgi:phosphopantothenoylcysteine decarboxylase/phosphopantothenate--cysteine ligase
MENLALKDKCVVVGVTGGIAAYKICALVSMLKKSGADARVVMTENAARFVAPLTFETLSGNPVITDTFAPKARWEVEHISLAKRADVAIVAPATANFIGKYAGGIADDFLTTTVFAMTCPMIIAPAMNTAMFRHAAVQANLETLKNRGVQIIKPETGRLACGDEGEGRCPEPATLLQAIFDCLQNAECRMQNAELKVEECSSGCVKKNPTELLNSQFSILNSQSETVDCGLYTVNCKNDYAGKTVLITAGGTEEDIDPVRFIGNRSSGKMGAALAEAAAARGAKVVFVFGSVKTMPFNAQCTMHNAQLKVGGINAERNGDEKNSTETVDCGLCAVNCENTSQFSILNSETIYCKSTIEMRDAVMKNYERADCIIMAAAPADYRLEKPYNKKIKSESLTLNLVKNPDIAAEVGVVKGDRRLVIFAAETGGPVPAAAEKLKKKNADLCVANDVTQKGAGFGTDTNIATLVFKGGKQEALPLMSKRELADVILDKIK